MKHYRAAIYLVPAVCVAGLALWRTMPVQGIAEPATLPAHTGWSEFAAAKYLDQRELWWQSWPKAQRDHGTICISCHTTVPYAMARPVLGQGLGEASPPSVERVLVDNVERRVGGWSEMVPFYSDDHDGPGKTAESRSTEAVMNAVILTSYDGRAGKMRPITMKALDAAWALQIQSGDGAGGWIWQDFHLAPWESHESSYQGAAMLMMSVGASATVFVTTAEDKRHVKLLQAYLRKHYSEQPLLNQLYVYWASAASPGLLGAAERTALLKKIESLQQVDGGWRSSALESRERVDKTSQPTASDGFATALVALALEANNGGSKDQALSRGLSWLEQHQGSDGRWQAYSLNKERDPESNIGKFMSDAATGYAVLALEQSR